jgi:hypothetical protein
MKSRDRVRVPGVPILRVLVVRTQTFPVSGFRTIFYNFLRVEQEAKNVDPQNLFCEGNIGVRNDFDNREHMQRQFTRFFLSEQ